MSGRLNIAAQLIQDREFDIALQMLEKETANMQACYWLSLLYRYQDDYDKEKTIVDKALALDSSNTYMRERLAWHNLPIFDRLVPRQPLRLPRDPKMIPSQDVLDQLCFVTTGGSDEPYYSLLVELLESIQATASYSHIPILIIDAGLTDAHKQYLMTTFLSIKEIKNPGWDVDITKLKGRLHNKDNFDGYKAMTTRPFIPKHFPGYRYYFWLDTDTWIQDENGIDELIYLSCTQGIGICEDVHTIESFYHSKHHTVFPKYQTPEILARHAIINGVFCIDLESGLFDVWRRYFLEMYDAGYFYHFTDQLSLCIMMAIEGKNMHIVPFQDLQYLFFLETGCPLIDDDGIMYNHNKKIIPIFHFIWYAKERDRFYRPFVKIDQYKNQQRCAEIETQYYNNQPSTGDDIKFTSISYRTWPWADKSEIMNLLMKEVKSVLES